MKKEGYCLSSPSWLSCSWRSARERFGFTARSTRASSESSATATKASAPSAARRPSSYLLAASALLLVSACLALAENENEGELPVAHLLGRGWQPADRLPCPGARAGAYYEIESESTVVEALALPSGQALASRLPFPDPVLQCREIPHPHFIQEIE